VLVVAIVYFGVADLLARILISRENPGRSGSDRATGWFIVYGGALAAAAAATGGAGAGHLVVAGFGVASAVAGRAVIRHLHLTGYLSVVTTAQFRIAAVAWLAHFAVTSDSGPVATALLVTLAGTAMLVLPVLLVDNFLLQEAAGWRNRAPGEPGHPPPARQPRVCVQVPCYAEPPEVVKATLDALARLDYDNYEVVVIDNNTRDEALWRPVQEHCRRLGDRFRFFHVDRLDGAKAGALNYATARLAAEVELIAVVDADYQAEPGYLRDLAGAFADPGLAFVQTSHDYRDFTDSAYQRGCYWEYRASYGGYMRSRSLRGTALLTGTMCVIRKRALDEVGGWAQWCCTEDSELSVRLHAAGYAGRYLHRTYGRGLIPQEYAGYKKQRYRWIYGPTQEFRRHWRLFLPARWATPSALRPAQKFLFAHHGVREFAVAAASLVTTGTVAGLCVLLALGASVGVPAPVVAGLAAGAVSASLTLWPLFRRVVGCTRAQATRAILCRLALFDTRLAAGLAGWRTASGAFLRTSKFRASSNLVRAVTGTGREAVRGLAALALAGWGLLTNPTSGLMVLLAGYLLVRATGWFAAPALALSADRALPRE
jgi:cellulose synthase/poly-beta-1,6-N-acetylglucosamine synthase-like glycosyltransferase